MTARVSLRNACALPRVRRLCTLATLLLVPGALPAQERTLDWPDVTVAAHLDADGTLHVLEQQAIRFTGDWNGGERRFTVRSGQAFELRGMSRVDRLSGAGIQMVAGSLAGVDEYRLVDDHVLRWRSRLPDAPAFNGELLTYRLAYRYRYILNAKRDNQYVLAHDFAFADRDAPIERFRVTLTLDSAWRAGPDFTGRYEATSLLPGEGFVVRLPLTRTVPDRPTAVRLGTGFGLRALLAVASLLVAAWYLARLAAHARRRAQFEPVLLPEQVTREFLEAHIFAHPAEVIGAAQDFEVGSAEVAALVARWISEGKLSSDVTTDPEDARASVLHLRLLVPRSQFVGYERALLNALFTHGATTTSTTAIRARYREHGFNPALEIMDGVHDRVRALAIDDEEEDIRLERRFQRRTTYLLFGAGLFFLVRGAFQEQYGGGVAGQGLLVLLLLWGLGWWLASARRDAAPGFAMSFGLVSGFVGAIVATWCALLLAAPWPLDAMPLVALTIWVAAVVRATAATARTPLSADRSRLRLRLAAARAWFDTELRRPAPQIEPGWYPYLVAFGLTKQADAWFSAIVGTAAPRPSIVPTSGRSRSSSAWSGSDDDADAAPSAEPAFAGFGGGGGFSGAGGGSDFGSAISALADSIPAQSSRTSGGGGASGGGGGGGGRSSGSSGGGSSSGGGGGGGW